MLAPQLVRAFVSTRLRVRLALALLLSALLLSQTLGLVHGVVHMHRSQAYSAAAHELVEPNAVATGDHQHGLLAALFGGHGSDTDCRLYDQLSHADAMPGAAALVLPLVLVPFAFAVSAGLAVARWHALFQARGPPLIR